jgi:hypothetical protein
MDLTHRIYNRLQAGWLLSYHRFVFLRTKITSSASPALYFSSIFCAQNSRKLSDMKPAELKNLFAEFLRLDRYVKWEEIAKGARRICDTAAGNMVGQQINLQNKITMMGNPHAELNGANSMLAGVLDRLDLAKANIAKLTETIDGQKKEVAESQINRQRIKDHDKIFDDLSNSQIKADKQWQKEKIHRQMMLKALTLKLASQREILEDKWRIDAAVIARAIFRRKFHGIHLPVCKNRRENNRPPKIRAGFFLLRKECKLANGLIKKSLMEIRAQKTRSIARA